MSGNRIKTRKGMKGKKTLSRHQQFAVKRLKALLSGRKSDKLYFGDLGEYVTIDRLKSEPVLAENVADSLRRLDRFTKKVFSTRQNVSGDAITRAVKLSQRFHGFRPRRLTGVNVTWPKALVLIGHVVRLDYLSDKEDGKTRCYTHDFQAPVSVFASGSAKTGQKNILLLHGNFSITQEGIVG